MTEKKYSEKDLKNEIMYLNLQIARLNGEKSLMREILIGLGILKEIKTIGISD